MMAFKIKVAFWYCIMFVYPLPLPLLRPPPLQSRGGVLGENCGSGWCLLVPLPAEQVLSAVGQPCQVLCGFWEEGATHPFPPTHFMPIYLMLFGGYCGPYSCFCLLGNVIMMDSMGQLKRKLRPQHLALVSFQQKKPIYTICWSVISPASLF